MRVLVTGAVLGALLLQNAPELPATPVGLPGLALALCVYWVRGIPMRVVVLGVAGALIGYGYAAWRADARLADALHFAQEGRDLDVTGLVEGLPQWNERGVRFMFRVEEGAAPSLIALAWYAGRDGGLESIPRVQPAQRWRLVVRLKRPRGLANPHAFDFEPWALERGIRATGYVRPNAMRAPLVDRVEGWPQILHRWRAEVRESMQRALAGAPYAGVLVALAIGDQDAIAPGDWDVYWRTGVGHLMSISGLHITMLAALAFALVRAAWVRVPPLAARWPARRVATVAGVAAALAYTLMTGFAVPAQRTFLMLAVVALALFTDRHLAASRILAFAAVVVIAWDPWSVLSPGFWLSFGAVAAIFYAVSGRTGEAGRWTAAAREQLVVTVAMLPMLAALFQELSLVSPLANAFAIPIVSLLVVPLALVGAFLGWTGPLEAAHALIAGMMVPLTHLSSWSHAMLEVPAPPGWAVACAVLGCAWLLAPRGVPLRSLGLLWIAPLFVWPAPRPAEGEAWLDVLDVGNGLAVVVRTSGHALAFDAGSNWSDTSDSGERVVVPYLRGEGVGLDGLVVSHADDDHAGGAISVAVLREPAWLRSSLPADDALHGLVPRSMPCRAGQGWTWDGVRFEILHPGRPRDAGERRKENDWSCVLRVQAGEAVALVTGDIEARSERELVARDRARLSAAVLVVPHHGSRTSSTPGFLEAVAPREAIFTVGHRNRFGHPHPLVAERYAKAGIRAWRSDRHGALRVRLAARPGAVPEVERLVWPVRYWSDRR